jgi:hypothetical protein
VLDVADADAPVTSTRSGQETAPGDGAVNNAGTAHGQVRALPVTVPRWLSRAWCLCV